MGKKLTLCARTNGADELFCLSNGSNTWAIGSIDKDGYIKRCSGLPDSLGLKTDRHGRIKLRRWWTSLWDELNSKLEW